MIKTINAITPEEFDKQVNDFEKQCTYKTGVSRVFAIQTHVTRLEGQPRLYTAVIFYREDNTTEAKE